MRFRPLAASLAISTALAAGPAPAQAPLSERQGPSFECSEAESEAEKLVCADPDLAALDWRLAERFEAAVKAVEGFGGDREAAEAELRASQRGWVSGRDDCWKADDLHACVRDAYLVREAQLVALYMLEAPTGTVSWTCDGNPANELVTYFFATELPSVRLERGDTVDAGVAIPAASGARYQASFGREFWEKGDEATYREADPDGTSVTCTRAG
jgi:uncharacterized protein